MDSINFERLTVVYTMNTEYYTEYIISRDGGRQEFNFTLHHN